MGFEDGKNYDDLKEDLKEDEKVGMEEGDKGVKGAEENNSEVGATQEQVGEKEGKSEVDVEVVADNNEISAETLENAKAAAEEKLAGLELKIRQKLSEESNLENELQKKNDGWDNGLKSADLAVFTLGSTWLLGKFLQERMKKKYEEKLSKIREEREQLNDEKLKMTKPHVYEYEVMRRRMDGNKKYGTRPTVGEIEAYNEKQKASGDPKLTIRVFGVNNWK